MDRTHEEELREALYSLNRALKKNEYADGDSRKAMWDQRVVTLRDSVFEAGSDWFGWKD